jgi:hypothetical protein
MDQMRTSFEDDLRISLQPVVTALLSVGFVLLFMVNIRQRLVGQMVILCSALALGVVGAIGWIDPQTLRGNGIGTEYQQAVYALPSGRQRARRAGTAVCGTDLVARCVQILHSVRPSVCERLGHSRCAAAADADLSSYQAGRDCIVWPNPVVVKMTNVQQIN